PLGRRVGDFRLYDHKLRRGAWLPTRFETWGSKGLRSRLDQIATGELGRVHPLGLFRIPVEQPGAS
ncbi:MAG: hypothetical protein KAY24_14380, partial [Candidatus Eisenbacteria sp.]|nr:hypothetical protein [Candidatus Eisenbacteria bacterium]